MLWQTLQVLGNCVKVVVQDGVAFKEGFLQGPWVGSGSCLLPFDCVADAAGRLMMMMKP
jgi:hypothetical protein